MRRIRAERGVVQRGHGGFFGWLILVFLFTATIHAQAQQTRSGEAGNGISVPAWHAKLRQPGDIFDKFAAGEERVAVIVKLKPPAEARQHRNWNSAPALRTLREANRAAADDAVRKLPPNSHRVRVRFDNQAGFSCELTAAALEQLANDPNVESIEPVIVVEAHLAQGIPLMNALASRSTYNGTNMAIAICDTGIDYNHPRLGGGGFPNSKVIGGYNFGDWNTNPTPANAQAHGTACAGIAAGDLGTTNDYIGGVAPGAKLYSLKISFGSTGSASNDSMIAAWDWCVTHKNDDSAHPIMVISTSFGGFRFFSSCDSFSPAMTAAASNAVAAGITVLASSGNDGYCDSMGWPACISDVISVGAVYDASFGTYFPCVSTNSCAPKTASGGCSTGFFATDTAAADKVTSYSNTAPFLDVLAPANQCYTTDIVGTNGYASGDYFTGFGGTSASCPYSAGAVAVLQHAAKALTGSYLTPAAIRSLLAVSGVPIADTKVAITKPRVDVGYAIGELTNDLHVTPRIGLTASGLIGGPFSPASQMYALSNSSTLSLSWAASKMQPWVSLSATNGTLSPNTSTNITVSINTNANSLTVSNYVDTVVFTNLTTATGSTARSVTLNAQAPIIFLADFEDGSGGYDADGFTLDPDATSNLWHSTTRRSASPTHSQWYGRESTTNYNTGARNAGNLLSPSISLSSVAAPVMLSFKYWLQTENFVDFDVATIQISTNAGTSWITLATLPDSGSFANWSSDISVHTGKTILVRFNFDTIDDFLNGFEGWYIDDVTVRGVVLPVSPFEQWQLDHFGCTNCPQADANADPDGDGMTNLEEFLAGTDPTNSVSALRITAITRENNDVHVTWTMGNGKTNVLQVTPGDGFGGFATNSFADLFIVTNTVGSVTNYLDASGATNFPSRYYRVRLVP